MLKLKDGCFSNYHYASKGSNRAYKFKPNSEETKKQDHKGVQHFEEKRMCIFPEQTM
jgi:hypothetical protein